MKCLCAWRHALMKADSNFEMIGMCKKQFCNPKEKIPFFELIKTSITSVFDLIQFKNLCAYFSFFWGFNWKKLVMIIRTCTSFWYVDYQAQRILVSLIINTSVMLLVTGSYSNGSEPLVNSSLLTLVTQAHEIWSLGRYEHNHRCDCFAFRLVEINGS